MPSRVERYLAHLDRLSDGQEPRFYPIDSSTPGLERVTAIVYDDIPEPGFVTGLTYGLSLSDHPEWRLGKPELLVSVRATDHVWPLAIAHMADRLRGQCPFCYGDTIRFGEVSPESTMTAFVVFAPSILDREDYTAIDVGDTSINIAACYPIHGSEVDYIQKNGLEAFWRLGWDPYETTRPPAV